MTLLARIATNTAGIAFIGAWLAYAAGMTKPLIALCALSAISALVAVELWVQLIDEEAK